MVALRARDIDSYLVRPDPSRPVALIYGPDAGLVAERAEALAAAILKDPTDPFGSIRLEGDDIAADPSRLIDEAMTVSLFGDRRVVRVRAGGKSIAAAVEVLAQHPPSDCLVIIEGGDLKPSAPLRAVCEKATSAVTIPCYADSERDLMRLVETEVRAAGLRIARDAQALLVSLIGGDRQASRQEIAKLILYARSTGEITRDDVTAIVCDASALAVDAVADAAFAGRHEAVVTGLRKALAAGVHPALLLGAAQRLAAQLHRARLAIESGGTVDAATSKHFPRLHFSRADTIAQALQAWRAERLARVILLVDEAIMTSRTEAALAAAIAERTLLTIALGARSRAA